MFNYIVVELQLAHVIVNYKIQGKEKKKEKEELWFISIKKDKKK